MNKIFTFVFTVVSFVAIMSCVTSNINCYAADDEITTAMTAKIDSYELDITAEMVYDFNQDGENTIADLVIAKDQLDAGTLAERDYHNVFLLMTDFPVNIRYQEFNLDDIQITPDVIFWLETKLTGYCIDRNNNHDETDVIFLNNGRVTRFYSQKKTPVVLPLGEVFAGHYLTMVGLNTENEFCIDHYSECDLDYFTHEFAEDAIESAGEFQSFEVIDTTVRFFFKNNFITTELRLSRIGEIVSPIETFVYEGEFITIGVTADGEVALDTYSFDLATN